MMIIRKQTARGRSLSAERIWRATTVGCLALTLFVFALPFTFGTFGSAGARAATGWDMVIGRTVEGYSFGLQRQLMAILTVILAFGGIACAFAEKDRPTFLSALCSLFAIATLWLLHKPNSSLARYDPVVAGMLEGGMTAWYWAALLLSILALLSAFRVIRLRGTLWREMIAHRWLYAMAVPVLVYVVVFFYYPIYGVSIAFKDLSPRLGILNSQWVGFKHFQSFFQSYYFGRLLRNTILISLYDLIFGFSAPILLALLLNEVRSSFLKRTVQTVTYLPHFISLVVICGLLKDFLASDGLVNGLLLGLGFPKSIAVNHLSDPGQYRTIHIASGIWQGVGWGSIIYLSALTAIDPELYEAARVDGAKRLRTMWSITLPGIAPTIIIMLILRIGGIMNVGHEKIILLYTPQVYETADVISSFVYRRGIIEAEYSFSAAVGLFNSVISLALVIFSNKISRKVSDVALW